jgi:hypothetical protein
MLVLAERTAPAPDHARFAPDGSHYFLNRHHFHDSVPLFSDRHNMHRRAKETPRLRMIDLPPRRPPEIDVPALIFVCVQSDVLQHVASRRAPVDRKDIALHR